MEALEHLRRVLHGRSPTQRTALRGLLRGSCTAREVAEDTGLSLNAVTIALHHLARAGAIHRIKRGKYQVDESILCIALLDYIEQLERRVRKRHRGSRG
ncbi:hypothetical protein CW700_06315 [Candidatus Bathyarchaeota archaeon]|nr:MAG: hypothetical protein CW700_06315 [Candidatus Bathyarchaeota archaeon]